MSFHLKPIEVVDEISPEDFQKNYLKKRKPVVIRSMARKWPAYQRWTLDLLEGEIGDRVVRIKNLEKTASRLPKFLRTFAELSKQLKKNEGTDIFEINLLKYAPALRKDYVFPGDLIKGRIEKSPRISFGSKGSSSFLGYDVLLSHTFQTQFSGRRHIILFDGKWRDRLYKVPYTTYAVENINPESPDLEKYPALKGVEGHECFLEHGDTLFIPSGWWNWMKFVDPGFLFAQEVRDTSLFSRIKSWWNSVIRSRFDYFMIWLLGDKYLNWKEKQSVEKAEYCLQKGLPR